ncbi:Transcription termination factor MTEF18, mitochondrial [Sesamum alatum]|uniref:Transcription termination factor MTEF18, mitochondrial n=1 Tax=Sesamum alatum TaxID=300844 RepID=A0AAE2CUV6_9LAMI|nr:Transcription termination factor MTEF18, mitochondrial [Sesamum alatum]
MFNLLCKYQLIIAASKVRILGSPTRFVELQQNASLIVRLFSSVKSEPPEIINDQQQSFTLSYLINSCGLSPEAAIAASKKVSLNSSEKPDLLLTLLRNHGLSDAHIAKMVTRLPNILLAHPEKTVLPKLKFFHSIGMPAPVVAQVTSISPGILRCSLEKRIIPFYNYLKHLLQKDERVIRGFKRMAAHFVQTALQRVPANVAILRNYGVNESNIVFLVTNHPQPLMLKSDKFVELVNRVNDLGMDISKLMFIQALQVLHCTSNSAWEQRKEAYRRWGWSESDIRMAFSRHPVCMSLSEKKIMSMMEFFVNEMNCQPKAIAGRPTVLLYSLEKRIVPRCRVAKLLMVKGLIKKSYSLISLMVTTDEKFLERFVRRHQDVPHLLDVYHGKMDLLDLGFNSSELAKKVNIIFEFEFLAARVMESWGKVEGYHLSWDSLNQRRLGGGGVFN